MSEPENFQLCARRRDPKFGERSQQVSEPIPKFDYLNPALDDVVDGLEPYERIYALGQAEYRPIRTLLGDGGKSAIYRLELTDMQREMVAAGADVMVEILHFGGPLAPSRVMLLNQRGLNDEQRKNLTQWLIAQMRLVKPIRSEDAAD